MEIKDLLDKVQKKKDEEKPLQVNELVKFEPGFIDKYPAVDVKLILYESEFGIREAAKVGKPNGHALKEGSYDIHSNKDKIQSLVTQISQISKKTEEEKYKRVLYQSQLVTMYKKKGMDAEFINSMLASMPKEYEMQITVLPRNGLKIEKNAFKIYIDDPTYADDIEKQIDIFREESLNKILEETLGKIKKSSELS